MMSNTLDGWQKFCAEFNKQAAKDYADIGDKHFACSSCCKVYDLSEIAGYKKIKILRSRTEVPVCSKCRKKHRKCSVVNSLACRFNHWLNDDQLK